MSSIPWGWMLAPRAGCLPMGWIPYDMCHSQDECSPTGLDAHPQGRMLTWSLCQDSKDLSVT